MRKITEQAVAAFLSGLNFNSGNTTVYNHGQVTEMRLHGNLIAERVHETGQVFISNAGWSSNTTKERSNGIIETVRSPADKIYQKDFKWYYADGLEFPSNEFFAIN